METEISIPRHLLESICQVMTSAFYFSQTLDLGESYRKLNSNAKFSPMTRELSRNIELIQSFIDLADAEEEEPESEEEDEETPEDHK